MHSSLLRIPHIVCVNKMDLVNYDKKVYENIVENFKDFSSKIKYRNIQFIPISALNGIMLLINLKICNGIKVVR